MVSAFAMVLGVGCGPRYEGPVPGPLRLEQPARALPVEPCEVAGEPGVPSGRTPAPVAEGELALIDVRGEDRLGVVGHFMSAWSSDGERLITATEEGVLIWKAGTRELERHIELGVRLSRVNSVVVSPDNQWIGVSGALPAQRSGEGTPAVWLVRASGSTPVQRFEGVGGELRISPDGTRMFTGGHSWDLVTGTHAVTPRVDHERMLLPDGLRAVVFVRQTPSPRESYVPELRELATGRVLHRFSAVDSSIRASLSGDGKRIALLNGSLSVFSTESFERVAFVADIEGAGMGQLSHDGRLAVVETISCGVLLASGGTGAGPACPPPVLAVWDLDRNERTSLDAREAGSRWEFTRDGRFLTGPPTRLVDAIIRLKDGAVLRYGTRIRNISPDSRWVLFDAPLGLEIAALDGSGQAPSLSRGPRVLARSADGRVTAGVEADGRLRVEGPQSCVRLGLRTGVPYDPKSPLDTFTPRDDQIELSPDGASLFTVTRATSMHSRVRAFRTSDGTERWSAQAVGPDGAAAHVLANAGQVLFQGYGRPEVRRFDATTGAELPMGHAPRMGYETPTLGGATYDVRDHEGPRVSNLAMAVATRDGRTVATVAFLNNGSQVSIWDLQNPRGVLDLPAGGWPIQLALSPDERRWAAGYMDGRVRLFPRDGGPRVEVPASQKGRILAMAFTRAGDRLASAAEDGTVFLIDTMSGAVVGRARLPLDRAEYLWVSPDGRELWAETARAMRVRFRLGR